MTILKPIQSIRLGFWSITTIIVLLFIVFDTILGLFQEKQDQVDVTDKIASLGLSENIHLNQLFKADVVCLVERDALALGTLYMHFPEKRSLRENDMDVSDQGPNSHIITIEDNNPIAQIFNIDSSVIEGENKTKCCSRNLVVNIRDGGKIRMMSIVKAATRCLSIYDARASGEEQPGKLAQ